MTGIKIFNSSFTRRHLLAYRKLYPDAELNILLSFGTRGPDYAQMIDKSKDRNLISNLILDSGTYTKNSPENKKNALPISLKGFIAFCKVSNGSFNFVVNYDEDFSVNGFETNLRNMKMLEKAGIEVVPVVHDYKGFEIDYYLDQGYQIIALGASPHKKVKLIKAAAEKIFNAGAKIHLLGVSNAKDLMNLPIHYCDSSSWGKAAENGTIYYWNPQNKGDNKTDRVVLLDRINSEEKWPKHMGNYPYKKQFEQYLLDELKMELRDLYGLKMHFNRQLLNIHYFVKLQDEIRKLHVKKGINIE
jgi:hypothetical protein